MGENRIELLSDRQKQCLRLVATGMGYKEIAAELEIAPGTVNTHLTRAMQVLGLSSRRKAARMLLEYEAEAAYQRLDTEPAAIAGPPSGAPPASPSAIPVDGARGEPQSDPILREEHLPFLHESVPAWRTPPFPTRGRRRNDLTWLQRIAWVIALTALLAIATGTLVSGFAMVGRIILNLSR